MYNTFLKAYLAEMPSHHFLTANYFSIRNSRHFIVFVTTHICQKKQINAFFVTAACLFVF